MLAVFAAPVLVSPPVSFFLIASVSFLCRTYVGLMSWPVVISYCLFRCCSLSGVPDFRCLIAFSFFGLKFGREFCKVFGSASEYSFFNVASRSYFCLRSCLSVFSATVSQILVLIL